MIGRRAHVILAPGVAAAMTAASLTSPLAAQNGRPTPLEPLSQVLAQTTSQQQPPADQGRPAAAPAPAATPQQPQPQQPDGTGPQRTRPVPEGKVTLAFNDVPVDEKIAAFIAEATGKVVMPVGLPTLKGRKITLINDEPVDRALALDLLFTSLRLNKVGIIETDKLIILDAIENLRTISDIQVIGPSESVMERGDTGTYVIKVFRLRQAAADLVGERLQENVPDYASLGIDPNSNQLILYGDIGLAQQVQTLIDLLDRIGWEVKVETFRLAYADATAVSDQIWELFDDSGNPQQQRAQRTNQQQRGNQPQRPGAPQPGQPTAAGATPPGTQVPLRVSVNLKQNSVTVAAEPTKVDAVSKLVRTEWDLPLPPENSKVYKLKYTDPFKVQLLVQNLLGAGGGTAGGRAAPRGVQQNQFPGQAGAGGGGGVSDVIGDIYRIEAYPDQNAVIVVSKTKQSLDYLDRIIESIDQPSTVGLPLIIELKHANAFSLADELNVLLAETGTGAGLNRPGAGLTAQNALSSLAEDTQQQQQQPTTGGQDQGTIEFPWQNAQPRTDQAEPSPLIGKVRIVPIERQNALAVLAPIAHQQPVRALIEEFDRPGRQVMISAIIAEVELTDDLALGLRFSSQELISSVTDNAIGGSIGLEGTREDIFGSLFDTSVLDANVNINVLLQAIRQKTNVRILQEPRVFTADNQEAIFFDGQDVPFITDSTTTDIAGVTQSFDYKAVGVQLDVRPRITVERDVDMEVNLVLSSIVPGQTLFGGFILDRRETTTKVIVKNGQTIVLSGILTDTESQITRGIPLLSELPLIGDLFKNHENSKRTTELIAFITPTVVDNPSENNENFNEAYRDRLRSLSMPLKEQAKQREVLRDRILAPMSETTPALAEPPEKTELPHTGENNRSGNDGQTRRRRDDLSSSARPSPQPPQQASRPPPPPDEEPPSP